MKTPPILLKTLQKSIAKTRHKFNSSASKNQDAGFTIIELLIIVLILGIFASIAAPSWLGFINRQRVRTVNDRVLQTLRSAQSEAKRTKSDRVVTFFPSDLPTATINTEPAQNPPLQTVTFDGGGEIKAKQITLITNQATATVPNSITFNYQGNPSPSEFFVTVYPFNGGAKQCVIVQTLIGGMRTDEGNGCPVVAP
ncbi:prepilin-type N-terminal cleavage/methylation domain-containing protein [Microcoleus sp. LEGE 07076]|uniref:prepilin-type N-terminal cleavage/methylation domain-containing protein n=1 Tax=Microcoleus sp. LEGE 07076 TaxID=915322 RepID=UPI00187FF841|nr:prepilin-type N-terminal cleavage/methylation domain-containing protein [Microcoleus sp. LEGE 07076]MBE9187550.1 prepilin-type N-terminal cleavage/methylation domain-containing protein [Microcoleus sp. LEGE 07076]